MHTDSNQSYSLARYKTLCGNHYETYCSKCDSIGVAILHNNLIEMNCNCFISITCSKIPSKSLSMLIVPKNLIRTEGRNGRAHLITNRCRTFGFISNYQSNYCLISCHNKFFKSRMEEVKLMIIKRNTKFGKLIL